MARQTKVTKQRVQRVLEERLSLKEPHFFLETARDGRIVGDIISPTFKGKDDYRRQEMLRDALDTELGSELSRQVGMLLAYTPDEWNVDVLTELPIKKRVRKAG